MTSPSFSRLLCWRCLFHLLCSSLSSSSSIIATTTNHHRRCYHHQLSPIVFTSRTFLIQRRHEENHGRRPRFDLRYSIIVNMSPNKTRQHPCQQKIYCTRASEDVSHAEEFIRWSHRISEQNSVAEYVGRKLTVSEGHTSYEERASTRTPQHNSSITLEQTPQFSNLRHSNRTFPLNLCEEPRKNATHFSWRVKCFSSAYTNNQTHRVQ